MNVDKTTRERENKRRFRTRRKEYVAELEKTVRDLRNEGVQATMEMQISARRVARENARLRELLRYQGVGEDVVEAWVKEDQSLANGGSRSQIGSMKPKSTSQKNGTKASASAACVNASSGIDVSKSRVLQHPSLDCLTNQSPQSQPSPCVVSNITEKTCSSQPGKTCKKETAPNALSGACKLVSQIATNPGTDITQITVLQNESTDADEAGGVECSKAYKMLMQFATSDKKLDTIAHALETGCVANSSGGCKVRNEVLWKALDDMQQD